MTKSSGNATATYLYCLVRSRTAPSLARVPRGLPGALVARAIDCGRGLWLIGAAAPLDRYGEEQIAAGLKDLDWVGECALRHERVVAHFLGAEAVAPMKLFTLFAGDERALEHIAKSRRRIDRALDAIAGCGEWGVRLDLKAESPPAAAKPGRSRESGTAFLVAKRDAQVARRGRAERARSEAERMFVELSKAARDARKRPLLAEGAVATRLLLDAVFLVPSAGAARFAAVARRLAKAGRREGVGVAVTGPWPPYSFVEAGR